MVPTCSQIGAITGAHTGRLKVRAVYVPYAMPSNPTAEDDSTEWPKFIPVDEKIPDEYRESDEYGIFEASDEDGITGSIIQHASESPSAWIRVYGVECDDLPEHDKLNANEGILEALSATGLAVSWYQDGEIQVELGDE